MSDEEDTTWLDEELNEDRRRRVAVVALRSIKRFREEIEVGLWRPGDEVWRQLQGLCELISERES